MKTVANLPAGLTVLIGAPGAGKTTWAKANATPDQRVSLDDLRYQLTGDQGNQEENDLVAHLRLQIVAARLRRGLATVIDATNTKKPHRAELVNLARRYAQPVTAVVLTTSLDDCLAAQTRRAGPIDPPVPDDVVVRMWQEIQDSIPELETEADRVIYVDRAAADTERVIRRFELHRDVDVSGVSGTGVVAEGVEFSDGVVSLRWLGAWPTSVVYFDRGALAVEHIHGHSGATQIVWLDAEQASAGGAA
jgi:predicted kinase